MGKEFNPVPIFESAVGGLFGVYETEQVNEENAARQARQNKWQSDENEKNRQFQRDMFHEQFQAQQKEWDRQQAYNTPVNQVARANAAGFNPSVTLAGGQGGLVDSTISIPSPSVPSGASSAPGSPIPSERIGFADMIRSVGSVIKDVSSAGLDDTNRRLINETMSDTIYGLKLDNKTKQLNNALLSITYEINNKTKQNKILDLNAQFDKTMAVIALTKAQIDTEVVKVALTKAEEVKAYAEANLSDANAKSVIACIDAKVNLLKEQAKTEKARQSELYASAYEHTQAAKLNIKQQDYVEMQTDLTSLKKVFQGISNQIHSNELRASNIGLEQKELENLIYQIEQSKRLEDIKNDWNLWNQVRRIQNILGMGINVGVGVSAGYSNSDVSITK